MYKEICSICWDRFDETPDLGYLECSNCQARRHLHFTDYTSGSNTPTENGERSPSLNLDDYLICPVCKFGEYDIYNTWLTLKNDEFQQWSSLLRKKSIKHLNEIIESISILVDNIVDFSYEEFNKSTHFHMMIEQIEGYLTGEKTKWFEWKLASLNMKMIEHNIRRGVTEKQWQHISSVLERLKRFKSRDELTYTSDAAKELDKVIDLISDSISVPWIKEELIEYYKHATHAFHKSANLGGVFELVPECNIEVLKQLYMFTECGATCISIPIDYRDETYEYMLGLHDKFVDDKSYQKIMKKIDPKHISIYMQAENIYEVRDIYFQSAEIQAKFHQNLTSLVDPKKIVMKCSSCPVGIVMRVDGKFKCPVCLSEYCTECGVRMDPKEEHICLTENIDSFKDILKNTHPCPKCASPIFRSEGCDHMFCVKCKTSFNWKTGEKISGYSNPHRDEWLRSLGTSPGSVANGFFNLDILTQTEIIETLEQTLRVKLKDLFNEKRSKSRSKVSFDDEIITPNAANMMLFQRNIHIHIFNEERFYDVIRKLHHVHKAIETLNQNYFADRYHNKISLKVPSPYEIENLDLKFKEFFSVLLEAYDDFLCGINKDSTSLRDFASQKVSEETNSISFMRLFVHSGKEKVVEMLLKIHDLLYLMDILMGSYFKVQCSDLMIIAKNIAILLCDLPREDLEFLNIQKPVHDYPNLSMFAEVAFSKPASNKVLELIWHAFECKDENIDGRQLDKIQIKLKGSSAYQRIYILEDGQYIRKKNNEDGKFHQEKLTLTDLKGAMLKASFQGVDYTVSM